MHVYFSGIGGAGIGPLSLVAHQAGFTVSGSDKQDSQYIGYLRNHGISDIHIGQSKDAIASSHTKSPIDWYVYSSAVAIEQADSPEMQFCRKNNIKMTKRDEFINAILSQKNLKLIAVAGTHGKTTTTAMAIWLFRQLKLPISYSVGAKLSFGDMGAYEEGSEYFIYEADEFDRNFLAFHPEIAIITGIDWDHPDIYPTRESYEQAFAQFVGQSKHVVMWQDDTPRMPKDIDEHIDALTEDQDELEHLTLGGAVNRRNACEVIVAVHRLTGVPVDKLTAHMNKFPGLSRRFEEIAPNIYSDYAHTPPKIRGALQLAHEIAGDNVVVVYEGLHNTRQHFIKEELVNLFDNVKQLYVVPSYLAREDKTLQLLTSSDLVNLLSNQARTKSHASDLNEELKHAISHHAANGDIVLCLTAGGGGSLDEWLRQEFSRA